MSGLKDIFFITPKAQSRREKAQRNLLTRKKLIPVVWILTNNMHLKVATRASVTTDALWLSLSHYLVARISVSQLHTRPTVLNFQSLVGWMHPTHGRASDGNHIQVRIFSGISRIPVRHGLLSLWVGLRTVFHNFFSATRSICEFRLVSSRVSIAVSNAATGEFKHRPTRWAMSYLADLVPSCADRW